MRARIEAAQKRRSRRRSRCICAWATLVADLVTVAVLLREGSGPIVSISRAVHLQASIYLTWPSVQLSWITIHAAPMCFGDDRHFLITTVR